MSRDSADRAGRDSAARPWAVRSWLMWEMPGRLVMPVLLVELTAFGLVIAAFVSDLRLPVDDLFPASLLTALGLVHTEAALGVERFRRRIGPINHVDLTSVWIFAAAVVVHPVLAALVVVVVQAHMWLRTGRPRVMLYRQVFTTSTMVLASLAASAVVRSLG